MTDTDEIPPRVETLNDEDAIATCHASKKFTRSLKRSMAHGLLDLSRNLIGRPTPTDRLRTGEFWAVDDVTLTVRRRERLGIVGRNGSGKSTLLRLIAGILPPDRGEIAVRGRLITMVNIGTGFHPHLSGRENIYLNGSILGLTRDEIDDRFDAIVDFADLGEVLDMPVGTYSTGMRGRLGFAVSTALEPDILLLDEVLAAGDLGWRQRCFRRLDELNQDTTLVLVTHLPTHIQRVCNRVIWLHEGRVRADGPTDEVLGEYAEAMARIHAEYVGEHGGGALEIEEDWV